MTESYRELLPTPDFEIRTAGFSERLRRVVLLGTPLSLAILEFFHPLVSRDVAGTLFPVAGWWVTLHVVQLVLFTLMGAALWLLTDGLRGIATTVSRLGAAVFVVFYGAGDTLMGIATGILLSPAFPAVPECCVLAVLLCHLLQRVHYPAHVLGGKHRMDLNGSAQSEVEGFHDSGDLGSVVNMDDEVSASCPFNVREVRCLGLEII